MPRSRIVELSEIIHEHTCIVDDYLASNSLPTPSFDISYPSKIPVPPEIERSQHAILAATDELTALIMGPAMMLVAKNPFNIWSSIQAIERFGMAKSFPVGESATFEQIAQACSLPEADIRRIIRHAVTNYVFEEPEPGTVRHTAASKALATIPPFADVVGFMANEMWPASSRIADAMAKWPGSQEPNESGFNIAYATELPMMEVMGQDPARAKRMAGAMQFQHSRPELSISHVVNNLDWGNAARCLLVDIGGGNGTVCAEIARSVPNIRCIVQDLPEVVQGIEIPEDLREGEKLKLMAHDFFQEQPVEGADIYLLRWVLHDWSDKYAVKIIQNLIPALKEGARVVVNEWNLALPTGILPYEQRDVRGFDLGMKAMQNAKERDAQDWKNLFHEADPRFELQDIITPPGADLAIICATWRRKDNR